MAEEHKKLDTPENAASPEQGEAKKEPETLEGMLYCWAQALITAVVGVVLLFTFAFRLIGVSGPSMQDTLYTGDRLLVLNAAFCDFQPGDVVVINNYNADLSDTLIKRIIAREGDTVQIDFEAGMVFVNGQLLEEPYINEATTLSGDIPFPVTVPPGCFFVLGDNRNHSQDSRSSALGFVPLDDIEGRAVFRFAPLSRFGPIEDRRP